MLYAVGDIHGEQDRLEELIASLPLESDDELVFLGDYIDRGANSRGVVEYLIRLRKSRNCVFLIGNHESMFLDFLGWTDERYLGGEAFLANGGAHTLRSYGYFELPEVQRSSFRLPPDHEDFYLSLQLHHHAGKYVFVHAGLDFQEAAQQDVHAVLGRTAPRELLWDRTSCDLPHGLGMTMIYGHTPGEDFNVRWNLPYSIGIDTGAVYGGPLTAIRLPDEMLFQIG
ncbi:MAG: metallophosphoesterase family protein [Myxococcota bacterium]